MLPTIADAFTEAIWVDVMLPVMEEAFTEPIWEAMIRPMIDDALTLAMSFEVSVPTTLEDAVTTLQAPATF